VTQQLAAPPSAPPWQDLLRPGGRFVALPSRGSPVVVAESSAGVLDYVRTALLAAPPGSRLPGWAYAAAGHVLGMRGAWWVLPHASAPASGPGTAEVGGLSEFTTGAGRQLVVLQHSHDADAPCILLLFPPGDSRPSHAVKLATSDAAAARVHREAAQLRAVAERTADVLDGRIPRVVGMLDHHGLPALVTTAVAGVPMLVHYHRPGHTADPQAVGADLAAAQRCLSLVQYLSFGPAEPLDVAPGVPERLAELCAVDPLAERVLARLGALRRRLAAHRAPATLVHGDFWPGNLLVDGTGVPGLVDWERSRCTGSPMRDPARFVMAYSYYLDRHTRPGRRVAGHPQLVAGAAGAGVRYCLDGSGWYPAAVRGFLGHALARYGLPDSAGRDVVLAEIAATAAEATDRAFAHDHLQLFLTLWEAAER
jgi:hypothetical protein